MSDFSLIVDERRSLCKALVSFSYLLGRDCCFLFPENFIMYFNSKKYYFGTMGEILKADRKNTKLSLEANLHTCGLVVL